MTARVAALETLLANVSRLTVDGQPTIRISNANLQVVSGSNATSGAPNGRGNIIIGYNEKFSEDAARSGSHMLVIGPGHSYSGYVGQIVGLENQIGDGETPVGYASVNGVSNRAMAEGTSVNGGYNNFVNGANATISGGRGNTLSGQYATVLGGKDVVGGVNDKSYVNNRVDLPDSPP